MTLGVSDSEARVTNFTLSYTLDDESSLWRYYTYPGTATVQVNLQHSFTVIVVTVIVDLPSLLFVE